MRYRERILVIASLGSRVVEIWRDRSTGRSVCRLRATRLTDFAGVLPSIPCSRRKHRR